MSDPFFSPMARTLNRNLLKHSAGTAIFCPHCGQVADCRRWVVASLGERTHGLCAKCWDKAMQNPGIARHPRLEVIDGRVLFARPKRKKTAAQEMAEIAALPVAYVEGP